ncbi:MAG: polysaccharide pyruvyl transferase CsaB [Oscillospiraceae bacterium]|nr:polysaccharide pyruvyl transferase CsaB [Oscillospiraceae bacterium]
MKILHMISGGDVGGAKTHVLSLLAGLSKSETIHLICFTEGDFAAEARELGIHTTVLGGKNLLSVRRRILSLIQTEGYEIIHCHGARANLMGLLLGRSISAPLISTVHSDYRLDYIGRPLANLSYGNINRYALPRFDAWVSVSGHMTKILSERGFDPQRIYTLYNGVDFSRESQVLPKEEYYKKIGLQTEKDSVVFGIAARISPVKDMSTLVRAFALAVEKHPSLRLVIAGEGEEEKQIKELAARLCPEGTVCFAGWERDMDSFYNALDVNMLTSLSEGFPYALPEGARMGCTAIASNVGGVPALIDHGRNGLLFTPGDVDTLAGHILYMAEHPQERQAMGKALQEKTREKFSLAVMLQRQKEIYEKILAGKERKKKRDGVLICGAYGKGNKGDNTILNAIVQQLYHIDPNLPICVLSRNPAQTRVCAETPSLYSFRIGKSRKLLKRSELYISGGGTLMQDSTSTRSLLFYLFSIRQAKKAGCKVMLYGCGIGPISKEKNRKLTAKILNSCADMICVRDHYSLDYLKQLGVIKPEIHLTADPALLVEAVDLNYLHSCGLEENTAYALFSLRPWEGYEEKDFVAAAEYVYETYGLTPLLYCMESDRDLPVIESLSRSLRCPHKILDAGHDGKQTIALVKRMSLIVSMRLHTLIFAAGQGVPMVGVVYDPKVSGFLDDLGSKHYLPLESTGDHRLEHCIDKALQSKDHTDEQVIHLRHLAAENERYAAKLLKSVRKELAHDK